MKLPNRWMALCLAPSLCFAQTAFRADVHLIDVGFSVRDSQGKFVTNLTQDDFEVLEDGAPQKIAFFARSLDVPLTLGLVVDVSGSQASFVKPHQKDLKTFLHAVLGPKDRAFMLCFGNRLRLVADYATPDKDLAAALAGFESAKDKSIYPELGPAEIRTAGTAFYDALYYSSTQMLAHAEGRKALVIFSDGEDNSSAHHMLDAMEAAQTNNVMLFCVRYTEIRNGRLTARNKYGVSVMARIARETGGNDYDAREKGLVDNFKQIGEQLRSAYELGYHSTDPALDDTFHKISIRVKDPNLTVRSKTGYYARPK